ncbi:HlyD family secretion protein [Chelatococcus asaccharovorans]|uniref:HlyD family secretion protein n=1 Tax=Chelatococcus asaccharovorans TaxID=28210 RepID=UPI00224C6BE5|nr:HlyD family efflux transporter periplasmic adaptor subunit [Chelatococcus asaccharovorans]CAH1665912.1 HlyD family secretion protein [Chelatococcus asaccharovorans]CAH1681722.1 HlyD family secretion protein [Chelatococcus asaccharovorans]
MREGLTAILSLSRRALAGWGVALALAAPLGLAACQPGGPPSFQGYVEADLLFIGPDEAGRLATLSVEEGTTVAKDAPLFAVDDPLQVAARDQAKASLLEAQARLERRIEAQQRPEEIAILRASEARVRAALQLAQSDLDRQQKLFATGNASRAALDNATALRDQNAAQLLEIQRQIEVAELGARDQDIEAARHAVAAAEAALASAQERLTRRQVHAPAAGSIQQVYYRPGEMVPAGRPVVALLPPPNLKIRFFVPEAILPRLDVGQTVAVSCDGCAGDLTAQVSFLSRQAEYTPPVIYSQEERTKLVFMVEAKPAEPSRFRVGQPVTVTLRDGASP